MKMCRCRESSGGGGRGEVREEGILGAVSTYEFAIGEITHGCSEAQVGEE